MRSDAQGARFVTGRSSSALAPHGAHSTIAGVDGQREPVAALELGRFKVVPHRRDLVFR